MKNNNKQIQKKDTRMKAVLDLECTCDEPQFPRNEMEIIEIGAVILDDQFNIIDKFDVFVKPVVHSQLTDFCTKLTSIKQEQVDNGLSLEQALLALQDFFVKNNVDTWYSWGFFDKSKIHNEIKARKINPYQLAKFHNIKHINASALFVEKFNLKRKKGVSGALQMCNLKFEGTKHLALDDSINISKIIKHLNSI